MPYKFDFTEFKKEKLKEMGEDYDYYCRCDFDGILELYTEEELKRFSNFFKMLGNPLRLQILKILSHEDFCVCTLSEITSQQQTLISHHLSKLKSAGLVDERQEGKYRIYSIKDEKVRQILKILDIDG